MRILVVEDDQLLNKTLSYNLSAVGYSVDGAMSKAVAIRFLEKQDYDLIVLDVNLPDGNGFDFCREVKERRNEVQKQERRLQRTPSRYRRDFSNRK